MVKERYLNRVNIVLREFAARNRATASKLRGRARASSRSSDRRAAPRRRARCHKARRRLFRAGAGSKAAGRAGRQRQLAELDQQQRQHAAEQRRHRPDSPADGRSRTRARWRPRAWRRRRRSSLARRSRRQTTSTSAAAARCMPMAARLMPVTMVSRKKPPASASESRFEMVMVKRSLEAANAIRAGNSKSLIASVSMIVVLASNRAASRQTTPRKLAVRLARAIFTSRKRSSGRWQKSKRLRPTGRSL